MSKRLLQAGKAARAIGSLQVDQAAREFLSKRILSEDPKYTPYQNPR